MKVIGLTGGVGAGKSTILKILQEMYKCQMIEADAVSHDLMEPGGANYQAVVAAYGLDIVLPNRQIDRKKLALLAFSSPEETKKLNSITHPNIHTAIAGKIIRARENGCPLLILEAAMIHQAGLLSMCDEVWYVHVPAETRKKRIMETRGYEEKRAEAVIKLQPSEQEYRFMSTWEIQNDVPLEEVQAQIAAHMADAIS